MLHPFISTRALRGPRLDLGGLSTSVMLHAGLAALAIVATSPDVTRSVTVHASGVEHVVFTGIAHADPMRLARLTANEARRIRRGLGRSRTQRVAERPAPVAPLDLAALQLDDDAVLAVLDAIPADNPGATLEAMASSGIEFAHDALDEVSGNKAMKLKPNAGNERRGDTNSIAARPNTPLTHRCELIE